MTSLVTDQGLADIVGSIVADNAMKYLGWGGGSGQDVTAIDLAAPFSDPRAVGVRAIVTTNTAGDTYQVTGTIAATSNRAVTEVGLFSDPLGAVMDIYGDFAEIDLETNDAIAFTIDVIVDQA